MQQAYMMLVRNNALGKAERMAEIDVSYELMHRLFVQIHSN